MTVRPVVMRSTRCQNRPLAQSIARAAADSCRISTSASSTCERGGNRVLVLEQQDVAEPAW